MRRKKGGASANRCKLKSVSPPQLWYCDTRVGKLLGWVGLTLPERIAPSLLAKA